MSGDEDPYDGQGPDEFYDAANAAEAGFVGVDPDATFDVSFVSVAYCGCCGREIEQGTDEWCIDCLREHIDTNAARPEDRTWFAQHGTDCPFTDGRRPMQGRGVIVDRYETRRAAASGETPTEDATNAD